MCKLFSIVEIEDKRNAELFAKHAIPLITKIDDDGLGIMRLGERGIHIQRWLEPPVVVRRKKSVVLEKYEKALLHQRNEEGTRSRNLYAIAVHGRLATCARSLENTHPFYREGTALMHNGIISNASNYPHPLSTCDSEALLSQYLKFEVRKDVTKLEESLRGVGGYYAAIVFNENGTVDIYRDDMATLYMAHVRDVGVVIATTQEIIVNTARKLKAHITGIDEILPNTVIRWHNGVSPQILPFASYKPLVIIKPNDKTDPDRPKWARDTDNDKLAEELEQDYWREKARNGDPSAWDHLTEENWQRLAREEDFKHGV